MNGKTLLGVICIAIGGLLALRFFNIHLGPIFAFLLPFILIGCGIIGLRNGRKVIGGIFLVLGIVLLLGKLGGLFTLILSVALIAAGIYIVSNKSRYHY